MLFSEDTTKKTRTNLLIPMLSIDTFSVTENLQQFLTSNAYAMHTKADISKFVVLEHDATVEEEGWLHH